MYNIIHLFNNGGGGGIAIFQSAVVLRINWLCHTNSSLCLRGYEYRIYT